MLYYKLQYTHFIAQCFGKISDTYEQDLFTNFQENHHPDSWKKILLSYSKFFRGNLTNLHYFLDSTDVMHYSQIVIILLLQKLMFCLELKLNFFVTKYIWRLFSLRGTFLQQYDIGTLLYHPARVVFFPFLSHRSGRHNV